MPGLKTLVFSTRRYMEKALRAENVANRHNLQFLATHLDSTTAPLCQGYDAAFVFVNDKVNRKTLEILAESGTKIVSTMSTGKDFVFNDTFKMVHENISPFRNKPHRSSRCP